MPAGIYAEMHHSLYVRDVVRRNGMKQRAERLNPADKRILLLMMAALLIAVVALSLMNTFLLPVEFYSSGVDTASKIEMRLVGDATQSLRIVDLLAR